MTHPSDTQPAPAAAPFFAGILSLLPGVVLTAAIAAMALMLRNIIGVAAMSPMILSLVIGLVLHNVIALPSQTSPGVTFSLKQILRLGIILLGLQVTVFEILQLGGAAFAVTGLTLAATFLVIRYAGPLFGVDRPLSELIAAGTAICGASAVIAANTVSKGSDEDVAYAVACVSILGSAAMLIYPLLAQPLGLDALSFGLWTGATIHEVAQVAGAAFQHSEAAGQFGTVSKLTRVLMLAPLILSMAAIRDIGRGTDSRVRSQMPWFVLGFILLVIFNSVVDLPRSLNENAASVTAFLLSMALAAMGLQIDISKLRAKGLRPLMLGIFGWLFIAVFGLAMLKLCGF